MANSPKTSSKPALDGDSEEGGVDMKALERLRLETEEAELRVRLHKAKAELNEMRSSRRAGKKDAAAS